MIAINSQLAKSTTMFIIILLITLAGIISLLYSTDLNQQTQDNWEMLQAQQASFNTLFIAQQLLASDSINRECTNTDNCPFWSAYPIIKLTNNKGLPNKSWWEKNAYSINNSPNNAKFIVIKMPNNLYKIITFAENELKTHSIVNSWYFKK